MNHHTAVVFNGTLMGLCVFNGALSAGHALNHCYLCTNESSQSCVGLMGLYTVSQAFNGPLSADGALSPSPSLV